jgi:hypothetical protein
MKDFYVFAFSSRESLGLSPDDYDSHLDLLDCFFCTSWAFVVRKSKIWNTWMLTYCSKCFRFFGSFQISDFWIGMLNCCLYRYSKIWKTLKTETVQLQVFWLKCTWPFLALVFHLPVTAWIRFKICTCTYHIKLLCRRNMA